MNANAFDATVENALTLGFSVHAVVIFFALQWFVVGIDLHVHAGTALHGRAFGMRQSTRGVIVKTPCPTCMVIDGHPKVAMHGVITARWHHGVVGHQPRGNAPIVLIVFGIAARANEQTTGGLGHFKDRT